MSLVRKSTDISHNALSYKHYADLFTPYAFRHLQGEIKKMECFKVLEQINQEKCYLKDKEKSLVVNKEKCSCIFVAQMGLLCRHILQLRAYLDMFFFDSELVNKRWTANYYKTLSHCLPGIMGMKTVVPTLAKYPVS